MPQSSRLNRALEQRNVTNRLYHPRSEAKWDRFTGQRHEDTLGLYHMGARFYDPALGCWLSADTLVPDPSNPQSFNRFSYVLGNPLKYTDPTGHMEEGECGLDGEQCQDPPLPIDEFATRLLQGMVDGISDPARTEPILIPLGDGTTLVIMPIGSNPIQKREGWEWTQDASYAIGIAGAAMDGAEVLSLGASGPVGMSDALGFLDVFVAVAGSAASGDMWLPGVESRKVIPVAL